MVDPPIGILLELLWFLELQDSFRIFAGFCKDVIKDLWRTLGPTVGILQDSCSG